MNRIGASRRPSLSCIPIRLMLGEGTGKGFRPATIPGRCLVPADPSCTPAEVRCQAALRWRKCSIKHEIRSYPRKKSAKRQNKDEFRAYPAKITPFPAAAARIRSFSDLIYAH